jgi:DNA-binding MarR family transcriptional regulator
MVWIVIHHLFMRIFVRLSNFLERPRPESANDNGIFLWRAASGVQRVSVSDREKKSRRVNPEPFLQLDRVIHEKGRLAIMSMLAATPELSFTELRDALEMTDGNLTTHIKALQQEGYVAVSKSFQNNRPLTTCSLTAAGRKAFAEYINLLEKIVRQNKPK